MAATLRQLSVTSPSLSYSPGSSGSAPRPCGLDQPTNLINSSCTMDPSGHLHHTGLVPTIPPVDGAVSVETGPITGSASIPQAGLASNFADFIGLQHSVDPVDQVPAVFPPPPSQAPAMQQDFSTEDHMLRRKTPNGILPASYDGSHAHQLGRAPPSHLSQMASRSSTTMSIVPPPPDRFEYSNTINLMHTPTVDQTILTPHNREFSGTVAGMPNNSTLPSPLYMNYNPALLQLPMQPPMQFSQHNQQQQHNQLVSLNHCLSTPTIQTPPSGFPFSPQQHPQTLLDSLLNRGNVGTVNPHVFPQYWGAMAPTVQNALGPTMFNFSGQYANGWPNNGSLNPFQPAALRDSRYQGEGVVAWPKQAINGYLIQQPNMHHPHLHNPQAHVQAQVQAHVQAQAHAHAQAHAQAQAQTQARLLMSTSNPGLMSPRDTMFSLQPTTPNPFVPTYPLSVQNNPTFNLAQEPAPYVPPRLPHADSPVDMNYGRPSRLPAPATMTMPATTSYPFSAPATSRIVESPLESEVELRDQVFSWAHMVYLDLLKHEHTSRKAGVKEVGKPQKPVLFPKPPMLPASASSYVTTPIHPATLTSPMEGTATASVTGQSPTAAWVNSQAQFHQSGISRSAGLPEWGDAGSKLSGLDGTRGRRTLTVEKLAALRRACAVSAGHLVYGTNAPTTFRDGQVQASAQLALDTLRDLIKEGEWRWVEGILLAGCLAYGLLDFSQAAELYQTVLEIDENHVEAISNLAATFVSMGRKQDAIVYWQRAIRLRPNHFDAVEHLVGLLCNMHQGRDAVSAITFVEEALRCEDNGLGQNAASGLNAGGRGHSRGLSVPSSDVSDRPLFDAELDPEPRFGDVVWKLPCAKQPGFAESGYAVPGSEIHRLAQLIHAKGNMLYTLGDTAAAARAFETAVMIATGRRPSGFPGSDGLAGLVRHINLSTVGANPDICDATTDPILLPPERAVSTARACFPPYGVLPGFRYIKTDGPALRAAVATTSNALLSLAKILQDGAASGAAKIGHVAHSVATTGGILALYHLSLALQPSPSTANNVGILLAGLGQTVLNPGLVGVSAPGFAGITPGSGASLALQYYWYGLSLDKGHAHLYTNLGSLLKDAGQLEAAVRMYKQAVRCDGSFDIALANLANAVKDLGRVQDAIGYYSRAVRANPDFAEAVCGLANALGAVCGWAGRGGSAAAHGSRDRWHVAVDGQLLDGTRAGATSSGWIGRVVALAGRQLRSGEAWGLGTIDGNFFRNVEAAIATIYRDNNAAAAVISNTRAKIRSWMGRKWEGAWATVLVERISRQLAWRWYHDVRVMGETVDVNRFRRVGLPAGLTPPATPTVLPFHAFTCPLSARQIRQISQRHGLRVSVTTLAMPWLPAPVYMPPAAPAPALRVGYVSSDFNNHPLAHLMQSVFGLHDRNRVVAFCYATTPSDGSIHRQQIAREAPVFYDASSWTTEHLVNQIVADGIHVLVNLNGYTRGARNEVFAARPAPIQMAFMGFAGTLGAEWCDYLLADEIAVPPTKRRAARSNWSITDLVESDTFPTASMMDNEVAVGDSDFDQAPDEGPDGWVYAENIIYCRDTFFCCDHRQSAPDATSNIPWPDEQARRRQLRKQLFPNLPPKTLIIGNFNQLYKLDPTTFRSWLRILARVPNAVLWLLRFPDAGETHLRRIATLWAGESVACRIAFTDVAPKQQHIARARICDLFLDTPECNAHTTAADVLWSGTPLLTLGRHPHKMCSRMAGSILRGALPKTPAGDAAAAELMAQSESEYEETAVRLLAHSAYDEAGQLTGRLAELRRLIYTSRTSSALFDTTRWVRDLEDACWVAWNRWVKGEGGDIWLKDEPVGQDWAAVTPAVTAGFDFGRLLDG